MTFFLKRVLIFTSIASIGYCIVFLLWTNLVPFQAFKKNLNYKMGSYGSMFTRIQEADTTRDVDILVLGSSHAYRGFDPRIFEEYGIKLFNLGPSNQTPKQANILVKKYLDQMSPELVIYEVYPGIFQGDGLESSLDLIANGPLNSDLISMTISLNHVKAYNAMIKRLYMTKTGQYDAFN